MLAVQLKIDSTKPTLSNNKLIQSWSEDDTILEPNILGDTKWVESVTKYNWLVNYGNTYIVVVSSLRNFDTIYGPLPMIIVPMRPADFVQFLYGNASWIPDFYTEPDHPSP